MADKSNYLRGVPELTKKLAEYGPKVTGQVLRSTVGQAMRSVRAAAESNLAAMPSIQEERRAFTKTYRGNIKTPGYAARHVVQEAYISADKQSATAVVGVTPEAFYAVAFVEFGVPHYGVPPRPWLVPAYEANLSNVEQHVARTLERRIKSLARKHAGQKLK